MNSIIYEINTRVWIKQFDKINSSAKLLDVPQTYWEALKNDGVEFIWLMGIWKTVPSAISKYCLIEGLKREYAEALPDWKNEDVIGSPFAIDSYHISPKLGSKTDLINFKNRLNKLELKLILDFIPNHFHAETSLLKRYPEIFLKVNEKLYEDDKTTYFKSSNNGNYYAHGKDPNYDAWQDTIQVNYFDPQARKYITELLLELTELCDGVRCDMAMLMLNSVFQKTWEKVKDSMNFSIPKKDFWSSAINQVKNKRKDFVFIAETYWNLEFELQKLGFDYTYDKKLYDLLIEGKINSIYEHLKAQNEFQNKSVRFIENHDEQRAITSLGEKSRAAAVIMSTIPGLKLFNDGQFEGKKIKLPAQLGREPIEESNSSLLEFYKRLLNIVKNKCFRKGIFTLLKPIQAWDDNPTHLNILAWIWSKDSHSRLVVVNYTSITSVCRIKINLNSGEDELVFKDILNDHEYSRSKDEIIAKGLYIQLEPFESHIFSF